MMQPTNTLLPPANHARVMKPMDEQSQTDPSHSYPTPSGGTRLGGYIANALRYWERQRLIYNAILALVVVGHFVAAWPQSRQQLSIDLLLGLFVLAVLANMLYCAVYVVDLFVQFSGLDQAWRKGRVVLLIVGTAFAAVMAHYAAMGMFAS
jgi:hypothetical protein